MPSEMDPLDFVDADYQSARKQSTATGAGGVQRPPSREELDAQVTDVQAELARLRQEQEALEREKAALEETRRRQNEWKQGREEMVHNLTRGIGLLEEMEFNARQEAEQLNKTITGLRDALNKVQAISEESWTKDNYQVEITKALTTLENARMEWNSARLKHPRLSAPAEAVQSTPAGAAPQPFASAAELARMDFFDLCRIGFALTWPVALAAAGILLALIIRK